MCPVRGVWVVSVSSVPAGTETLCSGPVTSVLRHSKQDTQFGRIYNLCFLQVYQAEGVWVAGSTGWGQV